MKLEYITPYCLPQFFISKGDFKMNLNTKTNTVKQILAKVMLVVILLICTLNFAGCIKSQVYIYIAHERSYFLEKRLSVEKIEYVNDDVTVDLSLGMHKLNIWGEPDDDPKKQLPPYFCDCDFTVDIFLCKLLDDDTYDNQRIKTITDEELFSQKYGYIYTPFFINNGVKYAHSEKITIPKEYFQLPRGEVLIKVELLITPPEEEQYSHITYIFTIDYTNDGEKILLSGYDIAGK